MTLMVSEKCEGKILWFIKQFGLTSYLYFYVTPAMLHTSRAVATPACKQLIKKGNVG